MTDINVLNKLDQIHSEVFRKFKYEFDKDQYGMVEKWIMPDEGFDGSQRIVGDCEDFALACRKLCRDRGITTSRLVVCMTETNEGHCVLEVNGWILDNRRRHVVTRDELEQEGYKWVAISGYESGDNWHKIEG
jgi:predicted transglutaminase-like cysteine proteinase